MARQITVDAVLAALGRVKYPGYAADLVSLGIIEAVEPLHSRRLRGDRGQVSENDRVMHDGRCDDTR